jgi:hypothetical protein
LNNEPASDTRGRDEAQCGQEDDKGSSVDIEAAIENEVEELKRPVSDPLIAAVRIEVQCRRNPAQSTGSIKRLGDRRRMIADMDGKLSSSRFDLRSILCRLLDEFAETCLQAQAPSRVASPND